MGSNTHALSVFVLFLSLLLVLPLSGVFLSLLIAFGRRLACRLFFRLLIIGSCLALSWFGVALLTTHWPIVA